MKFYSYDYLQSKLQQNNLLSYIIIAVLIVILCITLIKQTRYKIQRIIDYIGLEYSTSGRCKY